MIKPALSVLIPHLREPANDKALAVNLEMLVDNTGVDYELIVEAVATRRDIYGVCNSMVARANSEWVVFGNSDVFMAPDWAEPMLEAAQPNRIVTGVVVECGAIAVNILNHHRNFGMTPESFDREAFERWVREAPEVPIGAGWYFPSLHNRQAFLDFGGFDVSKGSFPDPLDVDYWTRWQESGREVHRVHSFCYHLQQYSFEEEQQKAVRHAS
jgi:GT2 family glycosyltransferase